MAQVSLVWNENNIGGGMMNCPFTIKRCGICEIKDCDEIDRPEEEKTPDMLCREAERKEAEGYNKL